MADRVDKIAVESSEYIMRLYEMLTNVIDNEEPILTYQKKVSF
jgi:hypothetical protein